MYTPPEVAAWLGIAPVTLRKWAMEFRMWLSPTATQVSRGVARRYTDADLMVLSQVRAYLARNFTFAEVQTLLGQKTSAAITMSAPARAQSATPLWGDPAEHAADRAVVPKGQDS